MRAVVIREPGGPEVLTVAERPSPELFPGAIRVAVRYAGVNRADLLQRAGLYPAPEGVVPDIPGLEYAGAVAACGPGATRFAVGDRVYGIVAGGAYAEEIVVHEREAAPIPRSLGDLDAAAVPEAFVTAYDALVVRGRLAPGEKLLVHAVGSGVGTAAAQIGRALGCFVVGTSRTADKLERARTLGLDAPVLAEDGHFAERVRAATGGAGVDVVLELVGGSYLAESVAAAASRARIVVVGLTGGARSDLDLRTVLQKRLEIIGTVLRGRPIEEKIELARLLWRNLGPWLERGTVRPVVDRVFGLAEAAAAHAFVAANESFGKVVLRLGD
ncbi:MAG: NAD(P)H-quinone oxidoreductase [Myxococcales bacterium]|nr:NAD(P)H-quinone oxidoreductase [Myxococcales bacterium]